MAISASGDWWTLDDSGHLEIFCVGDMPNFVYEVEMAPWWSYADSILSVTIENSVTSIGDLAFHNCSNLPDITIPSSVTYIGKEAFSRCEIFTSITFPDSVITIGNGVFDYCGELESVTIPASVISIGEYAFYSCENLTDVYYSGTQAQWESIDIGDWNDALLNATIHYNYSPPAFIDYTGVCIKARQSDGTEADITSECTFDPPDGTPVPTTPCVIPVTVTYTHGDNTFTTMFDIRVEQIATTGVFVASWPDKTTYTVGEAFDATGLVVERRYNDGTSEDITDQCTLAPYDGEILQTEGTVILAVYEDPELIRLIDQTELTVGPAREIIDGGDGWTLYDNGELVVSFDGDMPNYKSSPSSSRPPWYSHRDDILSVMVDDGVTSIGNYAFYKCASLTSVTIPDGVTSIGDYAFYECASLTSVTIPDGVTSIGDNAFYKCDLTSVTIPDSVTSIGKRAFARNTNLTTATIPDSATSIGDGLFENCRSLTSIIIPNGITSDLASAFFQCTSLTSIILPDSMTSIGSRAFAICSNLTTVTIPDSITSIGNEAFDRCTSLSDVYYAGTQEQWRQISIGYINDYLTSATIHYNSTGP